MSDVEQRKVKRYLFLQEADLTFHDSTQDKNVRSLYTEVSNVPHVAWGRVSKEFVLEKRDIIKNKNQKNPLQRMGAKPLVLGFRFGLIRASS